MNGRASGVASALRDVCQTQLFESVDASLEAACWGAHRASTDGSTVPWDVIFFNEGLHSLFPRTNVSDSSGQRWADTLFNFTRVLAAPFSGVTPTLIYDRMTPYMPAHWCNPGAGATTVEDLNELAVATVTRAGVTHLHDSYSVIFQACGGKLYTNCSLCECARPPSRPHRPTQCAPRGGENKKKTHAPHHLPFFSFFLKATMRLSMHAPNSARLAGSAAFTMSAQDGITSLIPRQRLSVASWRSARLPRPVVASLPDE